MPGARAAARLTEKLRRAEDFDHWASFGRSFRRLSGLLREVGSSKEHTPPASIVVLSGDVHHAYLAEVGFPRWQRRQKPRLPGRLLAVSESAGRARAPRHTDHVSQDDGGGHARARARCRRARSRDRLALPRGPLLRQPGGQPDPRRALGDASSSRRRRRATPRSTRSRPRSSGGSHEWARSGGRADGA